MSEAVEDDGMRAVRNQWSASAFVFVLVWEGGREGEEREAMAERRDERERRKGRNWTTRGGRERGGRCGGENLRHVEENRTGCACALDARTKGTCTVRRKTGDTAREERTRGGRGGYERKSWTMEPASVCATVCVSV